MSGIQYTDDLLTTEITNRQFIRRLYDPLRSIVSKNVDSLACQSLFFNQDASTGLNFWMECGGGQTHLKDSGDNYSSTLEGFDVTFGLQKTFPYDLTFGIAGSHEYESVRYSSSGKGKHKTGLIGLYGLYRPEQWYGLLDFAYGHSTNSLERWIAFDSFNFKTSSHPSINQYTLYGELGYDLVSAYTLTQLFVGIEWDAFQRAKVTERSLSGLELSIASRNIAKVFSRVGVHISTYRLPYDSFVSLDLAWVNCLSNGRNTLDALSSATCA